MRASLKIWICAACTVVSVAAAANEERGMQLVQAGFVVRSVTTPDSIKSARRELVPHRFEKRASQGERYYLYYDPDYCKCLYAGSEQAKEKYDKTRLAPLAPAARKGSADASEERTKRLEIMPLLIPTTERRNAIISANAAEEMRFQNQSGFADVDTVPLFSFKY